MGPDEMNSKRASGTVQAMFERNVVVGALRVSFFVGTVLNLINQGPQIWRGEEVDWGRLLLNYAVPYLVSSYSAARVRGGGVT